MDLSDGGEAVSVCNQNCTDCVVGIGAYGVAYSIVPLGLLHMCCLQRWFTSLRLDPKRHKQCLVTISYSVQKYFHYWKFHQHHLWGVC